MVGQPDASQCKGLPKKAQLLQASLCHVGRQAAFMHVDAQPPRLHWGTPQTVMQRLPLWCPDVQLHQDVPSKSQHAIKTQLVGTSTTHMNTACTALLSASTESSEQASL